MQICLRSANFQSATGDGLLDGGQGNGVRLFWPTLCIVLLWIGLAAGQRCYATLPAAIPHLDVPHAAVTPGVTARPSDPAWAGPPLIGHLTLSLGCNSAGHPLPTKIWLQWNRDWLYIRFDCLGPKPYAPYGKKRNAPHYRGDVAEVFLDPVGDSRQYFEIEVSPANGVLEQNTLITTRPRSQADGVLAGDILRRNYWPDLGYDIRGLRTAASIHRDGKKYVWTVDLAIPANSVLKRTGHQHFHVGMRMRMNLLRYHYTGPLKDAHRQLVAMNWSPVACGQPHVSPMRMGWLLLGKRAGREPPHSHRPDR